MGARLSFQCTARKQSYCLQTVLCLNQSFLNHSFYSEIFYLIVIELFKMYLFILFLKKALILTSVSYLSNVLGDQEVSDSG